MLRRLALDLLEGRERLPILIRAADLRSGQAQGHIKTGAQQDHHQREPPQPLDHRIEDFDELWVIDHAVDQFE